jgi:YidC/Oxa1 family membrane protein insertase
MEMRALLAVIISLIILLIYQFYFAPPPPDISKGKPVQKEETTPGAKGQENGGPVPLSKTEKPQGEPLSPASAPAEIGALPGKDVTVDTPLYTAVFDTRGARLKSWKVKKYLDKIGPAAKPLDLAREELSPGRPLGIEITEANFPFSPETVFQVDQDSLQLGPNQEKGELLFIWKSPEGLRVTQQMIFYADSYRLDVNIKMANFSSRQLEGRAMLAWTGKIQAPQGNAGAMGCIPGSGGSSGTTVPPLTALVKNELKEMQMKDLKNGNKRFSQDVQWGGFQDIYFLAAFVPKKSEGTELILDKVSDTVLDMRMGGPKAILPVATQFSQSYLLYIGPKDLEVLKAFGNQLDRALDFGWFDVVAKPMHSALKFFYRYTGNYGLAIIILTVIIKILFWYPTHISYKSMQGMKKIQPEMNKLKEKFKDDREKLNKEVMELYRRYKINPMSGCLPIAIQIPIFFALYKVLLYSIEIRHAPFYWWIQDLSAHDPYYISPIIMGASMFIQQWMTPTAGDPTQAKMMLAMPVIFTFMFLTFPTGLVIYWLFNNLLSIGQQIYLNKQMALPRGNL